MKSEERDLAVPLFLAKCFDRTRALSGEFTKNGRNVVAIARHQDFLVRLQEKIDSDPSVRDKTGARARSLEDPRRGRKAV